MKYVKNKINKYKKKPGLFGNLHLIINSCSIHSIYTSHIFTSVGSRNLCSGKWLSIFRSRSIFPFFFFFYILRKEGITSIIRKSIETQWSFTQSSPIFLLRLNAWFLRLPCQTTSKEIDQVEIVVFCTDDLFWNVK